MSSNRKLRVSQRTTSPQLSSVESPPQNLQLSLTAPNNRSQLSNTGQEIQKIFGILFKTLKLFLCNQIHLRWSAISNSSSTLLISSLISQALQNHKNLLSRPSHRRVRPNSLPLFKEAVLANRPSPCNHDNKILSSHRLLIETRPASINYSQRLKLSPRKSHLK